jgi:hypothetical protein
MKKFLPGPIFGGLLVLAAASCSSLPEDQRAYDACVDSYNSEFRYKPGHKAIVSGVGDATSSCFWAWSQPSTGDAVETAMTNCQKKYSRCFVYATDVNHSDWSQAISDNGGESDGARQVRENNNDAITGVLSGVAAGIAAGAAYGGGNRGGYTGGYQYTGGGQTSAGNGSRKNCPGATIAYDPETCKPLH